TAGRHAWSHGLAGGIRDSGVHPDGGHPQAERPMTHRRSSRQLAVLAGVLLALTACGSGSGKAGSAAPSAGINPILQSARASAGPRSLGANSSRIVENNFWEMQPDWSPDGLSLAFISDRGRLKNGTVDPAPWRVTLSTGNRVQLANSVQYAGGIDFPRWRPGH